MSKVPNVTFHTRVRDEKLGGDNPYRWEDVTTDQIFKGRRVLIFSLPGAFTPTCSTYQLPDFEKLHGEFVAKGIEDIYCVSVNDSFVMNAWAKAQGIEKVKVIPDGSGDFTIAFSTGRTKQEDFKRSVDETGKSEGWLSVLYKATVEATEESIINALLMAETMTGYKGNTRYELPHNQTTEILRRHDLI